MHVGLIVKVSKFCNLRCTYCCEMDHLSNRQRMSVKQIEDLTSNVRDFIEQYGSGSDQLSFYWHGGEPLVQPISYWDEIFDAQQDLLGPDLYPRTVNALQSNLTLVKPAHLPLFSRVRIGFSHDVVSDFRVDRKGAATAGKVEETVDWLISRGIALAGIVVVSQSNVLHAEAIADFYLDRRTAFRFILLDEALEHRPEIIAMRVSLLAFVDFALTLWQLPRVQRAQAEGLRIDPLSEVFTLLNQRGRGAPLPNNPDAFADQEYLLEIDTDGAVYSTADYPYRHSYGNIFSTPLTALLLSNARRRRIERSTQRLREICGHCPFLGNGCTGIRVSHATEPMYAEYRNAGGCELRLIADAIVATGYGEAA